MNYKNSLTGEVISERDYQKLPFEKRTRYYIVSDNVTHAVEDSGDDFLTTALTVSTLMSMTDFGSSSDSGSSYDSGSSSSDFGGMGGGDFGGGGSSGDY